MRVVALQTWSNGTITMDEKSVLDIEDALATDLIAKGIAADAATYFGGGGSGGGRFVVTFTYDEETETWSADKTFAECISAWTSGQTLFALDDGFYYPLSCYSAEYIQFANVDAETMLVLGGYGIDADGAHRYGS